MDRPAAAKRQNERSKKMPDIWDDVLDLLGLKELLDRLPTTLSGGERQRAALARAVLAKPKLLLADEPTGSLDEATGARVMELLQQVCQRFRMSLILVTHSATFAAQTHRRAVLKDGSFVRTNAVNKVWNPMNAIFSKAGAI